MALDDGNTERDDVFPELRYMPGPAVELRKLMQRVRVAIAILAGFAAASVVALRKRK